MKNVVSVQLLLTFCVTLSAQFYNTGSSPAALKWRLIETEKFQIIYPEDAQNSAQRLANTLNLTATHTALGLNSNIRKPIKIVLHNQNTASNGYVVWAPRRMELIPTLPQRSYAQNYIDQLALHEYRHVAQIEKLNQGFTRGLSLFLGEMAVGATTGLLPLWFLEGDAVLNETALSSTGRGREPSFSQGLMAIELEKEKRLTYDQIYLGTYRTSAPNHYEFGYQMVAYAQLNYGADIWNNTLNRVARQSFTFVPFYTGLKKQANLSKVKLYNNTFNYLSAKWKEESLLIESNKSKLIDTEFKSSFVSYKFPYKTDNGSIIALRSSIDDINKFVEIKDGEEKVMKVVGSFSGSQVAYSNQYIAWEERRYDPRWEQRNYSVIKIFHRTSGTTKILQRRERHFSPSISPEEDKIAVQKVYPNNKSIIKIYDITSGTLLKDFQHPDNILLTYNKWINNSEIAVVGVSEKGKALYILDINSDSWTKLFGETYSNITNLSTSGSAIYFTYTLDGRQNIYSYNIENKEVSRVTTTKTGIDFAHVSNGGQQMIFSEYTADGYKLKELNLNDVEPKKLTKIQPYTYEFAQKYSKQSKINIQDTTYQSVDFESTKYSKLKHSFNFHSWLIPFYADIDEISSDITSFNQNIHPGVTLLSQNMLSTFTSTFSYYYKEGYHYFKPSFSIRAFYPVITLDMEIGGPPIVVPVSEVQNMPGTLKNHQEYNLRITQPVKLSTATVNAAITPGLRFVYENIYYADSNLTGKKVFDNLDGVNFYEGKSYADVSLNFYATSKRSYKDINPKWGISTYYSTYKPIINDQYSFDNKVFLSSIYLPGLVRHHSTVLNYSFEDGWGSRLNAPRGYLSSEIPYYNSAEKYGVTYTIPVLYPDLNIGPVAYIKRLHISIFYDRMTYRDFIYRGNLIQDDFIIESTGFDLGFETNFLRFFFPVTPTIRYAYRIPTNDYRVSFFVTSSFNF